MYGKCILNINTTVHSQQSETAGKDGAARRGAAEHARILLFFLDMSNRFDLSFSSTPHESPLVKKLDIVDPHGHRIAYPQKGPSKRSDADTSVEPSAPVHAHVLTSVFAFVL